jgi:hypothetical protein
MQTDEIIAGASHSPFAQIAAFSVVVDAKKRQLMLPSTKRDRRVEATSH